MANLTDEEIRELALQLAQAIEQDRRNAELHRLLYPHLYEPDPQSAAPPKAPH